MLTNDEIKEGNKLIVECLGWKYKPSDNINFPKGTWTDLKGVGYCAERGLAFHSSWDYLMPVVKYISQDLSANELMDYWGDLTEKTIEDKSAFYNNDIETVYSAVVKFFKWRKERYNE